MHKLFLLATLAFTTLAPLSALADRPISTQQLPKAAKTFLAHHFKGAKPTLASEDRELLGRTYEVLLADGSKIEFDRSGRWTDVECKNAQVPASLVPKPIAQYVQKNFPNVRIVGLQREGKGYSVELSNQTELDFDKNFRLTKWDR